MRKRIANSFNNNTTGAIGGPPSSAAQPRGDVWDAKTGEDNAAALEKSIQQDKKQKRGLSVGDSSRGPEQRGQRGINRRAARANFGTVHSQFRKFKEELSWPAKVTWGFRWRRYYLSPRGAHRSAWLGSGGHWICAHSRFVSNGVKRR